MATASTEDIQRIVREVIAQLGAASKSVTAPAPAAGSREQGAGSWEPELLPAPRSPLPAQREGEVFVDSRVVTLESIAGRLQGARQLTVPPGALVTPAVRDELRRKGVALVRGSAAAVQKGPIRVLLVVGPAGGAGSGERGAGSNSGSQLPAPCSLLPEGIGIETETSDCMIAATDRLAAAVARRLAGPLYSGEADGQSLGLLWTRHTAVGLCLANRHAGVRAVLATGVSATAAAVAAVGANVLVVDPAVGTAYETKQILRDFCLGGIRQCPEALRERLEK